VDASYCHCGAFIPSGTLPAGAQYGKGFSLGGDIAGGLRLWKNGIGTAITEAESFVDYVVTHGYGAPALARYFVPTRQRVIEDNEVGRGLLRWVDQMLDKPLLSPLLQAYLLLEQRLPPAQQWLLPVFGATTTGKVPYKDLARMLRAGGRGMALNAFSLAVNTPLP
jgi:hypothetical protein